MASLLPQDPTLEQVQAQFGKDRWATNAAGCTVLEAGFGHAICEMELKDTHLNSMDAVMGGAIYTLADFALAIACNVNQEATVSVSCTIEFLSSSRGTKLIAEAKADHPGRSLGFFTVDVTDDTGRAIARMLATCKRVGS